MPLTQLDLKSLPLPIVIVIDALDECDTKNSVDRVIQLLAYTGDLDSRYLRVLITSRSDMAIRDNFLQLSNRIYRGLVLHDISHNIINEDIRRFLQHENRNVGPEKRQVVQLVGMAAGIFIWAETACSFIIGGKRSPIRSQRLSTIVQSTGSVTALEQRFDDIYTTVLRLSIPADLYDEEKRCLYNMLKLVLGSLVILAAPLSSHSLSKLLDISSEEVGNSVEALHAILNVPEHPLGLLRLHHPSFRDFLLRSDRCKDLNFWVEEKQAHASIANKCVQLISRVFEQSTPGTDRPGALVAICDESRPGKLVAEVDSNNVEQALPPEIQYSCLYWVKHFERSGVQLQDDHPVHKFLQQHLLHWLEALGWIKKIPEGVLAISSLEAQLSVGLVCYSWRDL
jgi:hypothetical protein